VTLRLRPAQLRSQAVDPPATEHPNRDALDALFRRDALLRTLGGTLEDWGGGWARVRWTPGEQHRNFAGSVHGGALFALGDAALAVASNSWGRQAVALAVEVQYLAPVPAGAELVAEARERSRTRRTAAYLIEVRAGEELVASLQAMGHRTSGWHLGEAAWPDDWRASH